MRLPWQRQPNAEPIDLTRSETQDGRVIYVRSAPLALPPPVSVSADDVASIARAAAAKLIDDERLVAAEKFADTVRELQRSPQYSSAAIPGTPPVSPQSPLTPVAGAPYPIYAYDTPIDWATPMPPQRRPRSVVSLQTLRTIADTYDVLRACIQHLKREFLAVPFKWVAIEENDSRRGTKRQIDDMTAFCRESGGLGGFGMPRSHFECQLIEDLCIVGMAASFYGRTMGGQFGTVEAIDAATIRPNVDYFGWADREWRWEQWVWGVMTARYTNDDLRFSGLSTNARSWAPYYASPVEWLISTVNTAIRRDDWDRRFFTDGNSADQVWALPETYTPEQVMAFTEYWDRLQSGDSGARRKTRFLPGSSKQLTLSTRKDQDFTQLELSVLRRTCAMFGVQPASIGFAGEQYKVSQEDSMESTSNFGVGVLIEWFEAFYLDLAERRGCDRIRPQYVRAREEKAQERATRNAALVAGSIKTPNEARSDEGLDPVENGDELLAPALTSTLESIVNPPDPAPADPVADNDPVSARKVPAKPGTPKTATERAQLARVAVTAYCDRKLHGPHTGHEWRAAERYFKVLPPSTQQALLRATTQGELDAIKRAALSPTVYLIRHGLTKLNEDHRVRAWDDPKLSKAGRKIAKRAGRWMVGRSLTAIKASDLKRTEQTAEYVSEITGAPIVDVGHVWRPWDVGRLAGRFTADARPIVEDYARNRPDMPVEGGESLDAFLTRYLGHLSDVLKFAASGKHAGSLGIVTHGRNIKAALAWLSVGAKGVDIDIDTFLDTDVPMGAVLELTWDGSVWQPRMVNVCEEDVPDLDDLESGAS